MILCSVNNEDAQRLTEVVNELIMCRTVFNEASKQIDFSPAAFKIIYEYYLQAQKKHNQIWKDVAVSYLGEDVILKNFDSLRFDPFKKVIYEIKNKECNQCKI